MEYQSLQQWLDYWLTAYGKKEVSLGLERIGQVKEKMHWTISQPIIMVGGTNGKGSTCAFLSEIYYHAGYQVGTLTSPHLLRYNERICINGQPVSDEQIMMAFESIEKNRGQIPLTYFEVNTLAAMDIFLANRVDIIILEIGMGGRLDAVNIFDPEVAIVTNVDLDHQESLGDTREKVGYEKAGIFRCNKPAIIAEVNPPDSLIQHISDINAIALRLGTDYYYERLDNQWSFHFNPSHAQNVMQYRHRYALPIPALRGTYQLDNASAALCAIECLHSQMPVDIGSIKKGLLLVSHPARFQILPGRPIVVLDVGHNPHAAKQLKNNFLLLPFARKKIAVFGVLADKDINGIITILKDEFDEWYIATLDTNRALPCDKMRGKLLQHGIQKIKTFNSIGEAYDCALNSVSDDDRIVAFGSFFTVAQVMSHIQMQ